MQVSIPKILALVIAVVYAMLIVFGGGESFDPGGLISLLVLLLPVALIWFPEQIGGFTGYVGRGGNIDCTTPGWLVAAAGWFFLVGLPLLVCFLGD